MTVVGSISITHQVSNAVSVQILFLVVTVVNNPTMTPKQFYAQIAVIGITLILQIKLV